MSEEEPPELNFKRRSLMRRIKDSKKCVCSDELSEGDQERAIFLDTCGFISSYKGPWSGKTYDY